MGIIIFAFVSIQSFAAPTVTLTLDSANPNDPSVSRTAVTGGTCAPLVWVFNRDGKLALAHGAVNAANQTEVYKYYGNYYLGNYEAYLTCSGAKIGNSVTYTIAPAPTPRVTFTLGSSLAISRSAITAGPCDPGTLTAVVVKDGTQILAAALKDTDTQFTYFGNSTYPGKYEVHFECTWFANDPKPANGVTLASSKSKQIGNSVKYESIKCPAFSAVSLVNPSAAITTGGADLHTCPAYIGFTALSKNYCSLANLNNIKAKNLSSLPLSAQTADATYNYCQYNQTDSTGGNCVCRMTKSLAW